MRRRADRVPVDSRRDAAERDASHLLAVDIRERALVRALEGLLVLSDRTDRVDDMLCGEIVTLGDRGLAGRRVPDLVAFLGELGSRGGVDHAADAAARGEVGIGGVNDGVAREAGAVAAHPDRHFAVDFVVHRVLRLEVLRERVQLVVLVGVAGAPDGEFIEGNCFTGH